MISELYPATRQGMIPLIGMYGKSGSGKTRSALELARGMAGPAGKIAITDTENKRSGFCADLVEGGFDRIDFDPPFTPEEYVKAIKLMEAKQVNAGVLDSMTHEWDGEGGVLEMQEDELQRMAGNDYGKREACKMAAWIKPKMRHKALVAYILRCKIPLICCLRAQEKTHMDRKAGEKTKVVTDDFTTPIYDSRFIFEMLINMETVVVDGKPGCVRVTKWSHPDLLTCLPKEGEQLAPKHGAAIMAWCRKAAADKPVTASADVKALKKELWKLTANIHHEDARKLEQHLHDENIIADTETLETLTAERLEQIIVKVRKP